MLPLFPAAAAAAATTTAEKFKIKLEADWLLLADRRVLKRLSAIWRRIELQRAFAAVVGSVALYVVALSRACAEVSFS